MWYRVFCRSDLEPSPADLLARVQATGRVVEGKFRGDDLGWTAAEFLLGAETPIYVERYLTAADNLREDLNTWAAWLETCTYSPNYSVLMERVIQSKQLITIRKPLDHRNDSAIEDICRTLAIAIASAADGIFQIESDGWYTSGEELLLKEY